MKKAYICSPYRAEGKEELKKNRLYARHLTQKALMAGIAPITPHLYMTQCLNESIAGQRAIGLAAGMELLRSCDFVIVGAKRGISEGMSAEIAEAERLGLDVVNADKLGIYLMERKIIEQRGFGKWRIQTEDIEQ